MENEIEFLYGLKLCKNNARKLYTLHYGKIKKGLQIHHILPVRLGGTHHPDNLVALTKEEHAQAHLELYEKYNDYRDYCAYHVIMNNQEEVRLINASMGGKEAARRNKELGRLTGTQLFSEEKMLEVAIKGGKIGGKKNRDEKLGIFAASPEERLEYSRLGGYASCEMNGFKDPKRQSERGKKGGKGNKGFKWYNDGKKSYKYTKRQQEQESFKDFLNRTGYKKGRKV